MREFKKGDLFYNSNNHLSFVYDIIGDNAKIINYNGTVYSLSVKSASHTKFNFQVKKTIKQFLLEYPFKNLMQEYHFIIKESKEKLGIIEKPILTFNKNLLLII